MKTQSMVGATGDLCRGLRRLSLVLACTVAAAACSVSSLRDEAGGESETIKGDWAAATPLFEKAYAAHPDVTNQFNLATAYQNTGQTAKAIQLYEAVVLDGQFTITTPITAPGVAADPLTASDLSAEATRQLALMASRQALLDETDRLARSQALSLESVLICDFKAQGFGRLGQIVVYLDDGRRTASTLGFFIAAANRQEVDRFDAEQIVWTQRYQLAGHTDVFHYALTRKTGALEVTRPDSNRVAKTTASCHPPKGV